MKKLLATLGTITIAGSGISGIVGNAPTSAKNNINYQQTNNLETLKRNKRNNETSEKRLDVIAVMQQTNYWCGPAVGEMILRSLELEQENNSNNLLNQENLSLRMGTNRSTWTSPIGFTNAINYWIGNRLDGRLYSNISLRQMINANFSERFRIFFNIVRQSLSNNMPVAIANYGRDLNSQAPTNGLQRHFLLFTGYSRGNEYDPQNVIYHYIDPGDGNSYSVSANSFFERGNLDTMGAWIIANTDQNLLSQNNLVNENYDPMEIENNIDPTILEEHCPILINPHLSLNFNRLSKRDGVKNYGKCYLLKNEKTIFEKIKDANIQGKVTAIKGLDEKTQGGSLKAGDTYVGTTNGVYLIHGENIIDKFEGLNFSIQNIILDGKGSAYIINEQGEIYHLNLHGWGSTKLNNKNFFNGNDITTFKILENDSSENPWVKKGYVILGTKNGVYTIHQNGNVGKRMSNINSEVKNIFVDPSNNFVTIIFKNFEDKRYQLNFKDWSYSSIRDFNHDEFR